MTDEPTRNAHARLDRRSEAGLQTYGVDLDREDLSLVQWAEHLAEEASDAAKYAEKVVIEAKRYQQALERIAELEDSTAPWRLEAAEATIDALKAELEQVKGERDQSLDALLKNEATVKVLRDYAALSRAAAELEKRVQFEIAVLERPKGMHAYVKGIHDSKCEACELLRRLRSALTAYQETQG